MPGLAKLNQWEARMRILDHLVYWRTTGPTGFFSNPVQAALALMLSASAPPVVSTFPGTVGTLGEVGIGETATVRPQPQLNAETRVG